MRAQRLGENAEDDDDDDDGEEEDEASGENDFEASSGDTVRFKIFNFF